MCCIPRCCCGGGATILTCRGDSSNAEVIAEFSTVLHRNALIEHNLKTLLTETMALRCI